MLKNMVIGPIERKKKKPTPKNEKSGFSMNWSRPPLDKDRLKRDKRRGYYKLENPKEYQLPKNLEKIVKI